MAISHNINLSGLNQLGRVADNVPNIPAELALWSGDWRAEHESRWESITFGSGAVDFRGKYWRESPMKRDNYAGRPLRPSGLPYSNSSKMMTDTGRMRMEFFTPIWENSGFKISFDSTARSEDGFYYPGFQNRLREFAFFTKEDADALLDRIRAALIRGSSARG